MKHLLFVFLLTIIIFSNSLGQTWNPLGTGLDDEPYATLEDTVNGVLYVGGCFENAGGNAINGIAQWDGNTWSAVGGGIDYGCTGAFELYNNELYAGGDYFPPTTGISVIGRWDGNNWTEVPPSGGQIMGVIFELEKYQGELYAGGWIQLPGEGIVKYDGSNWSEVGGGISFTGEINTMKVYNGELYAGGLFDTAGTVAAKNLAKWDGSSWMPVGNGINDRVTSLEEYSGELYVGTYYGSGIFKWDGFNWINVGVANSAVNELKTFNGYLYAGGFFTMIDSDTLLHIAKYDGNVWTAIGNGMNQDVLTMSVFQNDLHAGGRFTVADTANVNYIARWGQLVGINDYSAFSNFKIYPNPTTGKFRVTSLELEVGEVQVFDLLGNLLLRTEEREIDLSSYPAGIYFVRVGQAVRKVVLSKKP